VRRVILKLQSKPNEIDALEPWGPTQEGAAGAAVQAADIGVLVVVGVVEVVG